MKVFLNQISDKGREFQEIMTADSLGLGSDRVCVGPLTVTAGVQRAGQVLMGSFTVEGQYQMTCSRCAADFEARITDCFDLTREIEPGVDFIDWDDDIRQELILAEPVSPLCRQDCRGLCAGCGDNLNTEACRCHLNIRVSDPK